MERNSTIAAWRLPGGINSAADKGVSAMILSYHDSVSPTFADKQVNVMREHLERLLHHTRLKSIQWVNPN